MPAPRYLVAGCKPWNREVFEKTIRAYPGAWQYADAQENLTMDAVKEFHPAMIFFLHWSWIVPEEIVRNYECINFHMTDVPYGRGGSPLQNLILRGHGDTKLSALRMTMELDAGPVYLQEPLSLAGTAQEILERSSVLAAAMIKRIITEHPVPRQQTGPVTPFERRKPSESDLKTLGAATPRQVYDFIRMLDGEGYPPAFLDVNGWRYTFHAASVHGEEIAASVRISRSPPAP
jgi:methionyl-tRNA formyltransferase